MYWALSKRFIAVLVGSRTTGGRDIRAAFPTGTVIADKTDQVLLVVQMM